MLHNKSQIINAIKTVANALADLNDKCIYVGGAVTGLYADDPLAPKVRPTKDIDIVLEIRSTLELEKLRQKLAERDIHFAREEKVICRFKHQNILIDVMATKEVGWAPANPWFEEGFKHLINYKRSRVEIKLLSFDYFLATKFSAFHSRGNDPRISHDFEDIVYLLDNRLDLIRDIANSTGNVKKYFLNEFRTLIDKSDFHEAILGHLEPGTQNERFKLLIDELNKILK